MVTDIIADNIYREWQASDAANRSWDQFDAFIRRTLVQQGSLTTSGFLELYYLAVHHARGRPVMLAMINAGKDQGVLEPLSDIKKIDPKALELLKRMFNVVNVESILLSHLWKIAQAYRQFFATYQASEAPGRYKQIEPMDALVKHDWTLLSYIFLLETGNYLPNTEIRKLAEWVSKQSKGNQTERYVEVNDNDSAIDVSEPSQDSLLAAISRINDSAHKLYKNDILLTQLPFQIQTHLRSIEDFLGSPLF